MWSISMRATIFTLLAMPVLPLIGCKASPPSAAERHVIVEAKHLIFVHDEAEKNPLPNTAEPLPPARRRSHTTASHAMGWTARTPAYPSLIACPLPSHHLRPPMYSGTPTAS
jgi:hypothetical protein